MRKFKIQLKYDKPFYADPEYPIDEWLDQTHTKSGDLWELDETEAERIVKVWNEFRLFDAEARAVEIVNGH